jgi:hypothetical protein
MQKILISENKKEELQTRISVLIGQQKPYQELCDFTGFSYFEPSIIEQLTQIQKKLEETKQIFSKTPCYLYPDEMANLCRFLAFTSITWTGFFDDLNRVQATLSSNRNKLQILCNLALCSYLQKYPNPTKEAYQFCWNSLDDLCEWLNFDLRQEKEKEKDKLQKQEKLEKLEEELQVHIRQLSKNFGFGETQHVLIILGVRRNNKERFKPYLYCVLRTDFIPQSLCLCKFGIKHSRLI